MELTDTALTARCSAARAPSKKPSCCFLARAPSRAEMMCWRTASAPSSKPSWCLLASAPSREPSWSSPAGPSRTKSGTVAGEGAIQDGDHVQPGGEPLLARALSRTEITCSRAVSAPSTKVMLAPSRSVSPSGCAARPGANP